MTLTSSKLNETHRQRSIKNLLTQYDEKSLLCDVAKCVRNVEINYPHFTNVVLSLTIFMQL